VSYVSAPLERLAFFQEKLRLTETDVAVVARYRDVFLSHRDAFADYIHDLLTDIPETRRIVNIMEGRGGLSRNWRCWYEGLFTQGFSPPFYQFLWSSGLKHVGANVDQRFIHLAYCMARLFLGEIVDREIPAVDRAPVRVVIDKMLDQCLLVAADAFLASTTQCDVEVINGIAHQVRNPLTVIGGFLRNARKKIPADASIQSILDTVLQETGRLEGMVDSVGTYIDILQREPEFGLCSLPVVLEEALARLRRAGWSGAVDLRLEEAVGQPLDSDAYLLKVLFFHLLANAAEAAREAPDPVVRVIGSAVGAPPSALRVEIYNNGRVPDPAEAEHLFTPFYSSRPTRAGFGLPTAALIARKTQGEIELRPVPGDGTYTTVVLPLRPGG
jgi:signal transduction histidine kinase